MTPLSLYIYSCHLCIIYSYILFDIAFTLYVWYYVLFDFAFTLYVLYSVTLLTGGNKEILLLLVYKVAST